MYVVNAGDDTVSIIDTNTNEVVGNPIEIGSEPNDIAYDPIHKLMYVVNAGDDTVSIIDTNTNRVVDSLVLRGVIPSNIVYDPKQRMYVTYSGDENISDIVSILNLC
jgi:YVTN family beta-propeller protein